MLHDIYQKVEPINKKCSICNNVTLHISRRNKYYCNICYDELFNATDYAPISKYCYICLKETTYKYNNNNYRCSVCHYSEGLQKQQKHTKYSSFLKDTNLFLDTLATCYYSFKLANMFNNYYYNLFSNIYELFNFRIVSDDKYISIEFVNKDFNKIKAALCICNIAAHFVIGYSLYYIYNSISNSFVYQTYKNT